MHILDVLKKPLITEKNARLQEANQYAFEVSSEATKPQIKAAVESAYKVTVTGVNVLTVKGKEKRMGRGLYRAPNWKKALVTLKAGDKIQFFEGV
ncbi:50S ribosomal protein L23 [Dehalogenimonas etheniformans]|uniref:Large ribosomal subunit protein uL23 n=1 Tax=Dehalogenimonas etheniformans TaxID=1536648 RepID=A0A2P5P7H7_9CHLR|nr:50S ribosomal protein L23 [Dehalogenimonas etheniformans]PPD58258.1 50S ribosomal protein L23 [Dehalogenimonas etheniformans]QNT75667.1 50S ribosomal protein L23 [Dehalogenimonas etheniformans]